MEHATILTGIPTAGGLPEEWVWPIEKSSEAAPGPSKDENKENSDKRKSLSQRKMNFKTTQESLNTTSSSSIIWPESIENSLESSPVSDVVEQEVSCSVSSDDGVPRAVQPRPTSPPHPSKHVTTMRETLPAHPLCLSMNTVVPIPSRQNAYTASWSMSTLTQVEQPPVHLPEPEANLPARHNVSVFDTPSWPSSAMEVRPVDSSSQQHSMTEATSCSSLKPPKPPKQQSK